MDGLIERLRQKIDATTFERTHLMNAQRSEAAVALEAAQRDIEAQRDSQISAVNQMLAAEVEARDLRAQLSTLRSQVIEECARVVKTFREDADTIDANLLKIIEATIRCLSAPDKTELPRSLASSIEGSVTTAAPSDKKRVEEIARRVLASTIDPKGLSADDILDDDQSALLCLEIELALSQVLTASPIEAIPPARPDDKDFAIQFGEHLAKNVEQFLSFINESGIAAHAKDQDGMTDHWRGLQSAIYEFRKRATGASQPEQASEGEAP